MLSARLQTRSVVRWIVCPKHTLVITALVEAEQDLESSGRAGAVKAPAGMKVNIIAELASHD
jgi:hypothetical protein